MNDTNKQNKKQVNVSIIISLVSLLLSLFTLMYTIQKDNKESISLWCMGAICCTDYPKTDYWEVSGNYIITNNSYNAVSIIDAYVTYKDKRYESNLDDFSMFPLNIDAKTSYRISVEPIKFYYYVAPSDFKLHIISSTQKEYTVESKYYLD